MPTPIDSKIQAAIKKAKDAGKKVARVQLGDVQLQYAKQAVADLKKAGYKAISNSTSGMRGGSYNYIDITWDGGHTGSLYNPESKQTMNYHKNLFEECRELCELKDVGGGIHVGGYTLKKKKEETNNDPDDEANGTKYVTYDIMQKGKVVGELRHENYFNSIFGTLHGKSLPNLSGSSPDRVLNMFIKSNTGQKWAKNLKKFQ